jgi:hypothetical protein
MLIREASYFPALTGPSTPWSLFSKLHRKIYKILHLAVNTPGQSLRGRNIHPWPYSGLQTAAGTDSHRVGFAESCLTLIGQPFYKARGILEIVASVAGASAAATLAPLGGVQSLGPSRPGNHVEGNGLHTRLNGLFHRVVGRAVNCPLPGPPGLRSRLGGDCFHVGE